MMCMQNKGSSFLVGAMCVSLICTKDNHLFALGLPYKMSDRCHHRAVSLKSGLVVRWSEERTEKTK